jgi:hypothetical protein
MVLAATSGYKPIMDFALYMHSAIFLISTTSLLTLKFTFKTCKYDKIMIGLLLTYELCFLLSTLGLYVDQSKPSPTFQVYLVPACQLLNSMTLFFFIFEIERIRLFLSECDKFKYQEKREMTKAVLIVVIISLVLQSLSVSILNYNMHQNKTFLHDQIKMSLCLVSALLKVITDSYVYWVALRGINYLIGEYKRNAELALQ